MIRMFRFAQAMTILVALANAQGAYKIVARLLPGGVEAGVAAFNIRVE